MQPQGAYPQPMPQQQARRRPQIHWLVAMTCIVLIFASMTSAVEAMRELAAGLAAKAPESIVGEMKMSAYTNVESAHVTFTNTNAITMYRCVKGVVTSRKNNAATETMQVCTGDVKPHSTVTLIAPFTVGAVKDLCAGDPDRFGNRAVDWDRCSFDVVPVP